MNKLDALVAAVRLVKAERSIYNPGEFPWTTIGERLWESETSDETRSKVQGFVNHDPTDNILNKFLGDDKFILWSYIYQFDENGHCVELGVPWSLSTHKPYPRKGGGLMIPDDPVILEFPAYRCNFERNQKPAV